MDHAGDMTERIEKLLLAYDGRGHKIDRNRGDEPQTVQSMDVWTDDSSRFFIMVVKMPS